MTIHGSLPRIRPGLGGLFAIALLAGPLGAQGTPSRDGTAAIDSLIASGAIRPVIVVGVPNTGRRRDLTGSIAG